ncbi:MAG: pseudaminic acid synthase [Candidatus Riflebacteria bacterium]|nr:pseudaminic acid synthase [Candidatus Riflebacteria bacterium]
MNSLTIKNRKIASGLPAYIIAEMSANHAGSLSYAKEIIHAAKEANADCIKIQTYTADTITIDCNNKYFNIEKGTWKGENLYSLYKKAYTPWEWQAELKEEADKIGIDFFSTPFDNTSVDFLESIGIEFYKIASFELIDLPLIKYVASKGKPMIISTGMASLEEIKEAVDCVNSQNNNQIALLRCSSAYPAITDDMNLASMKVLAEKFNVPTGLSDHSKGSIAAVTSVVLGGCIIEKHFCLDRKINTPDSGFSMEPEEFASMVRDVRDAEKAIGKVSFGPTQSEMSNYGFRRSIFIVKDVRAGDKVTEENIGIIRPGDGLKPKYYEEVLGKTFAKDYQAGTPLSFDCLVNA